MRRMPLNQKGMGIIGVMIAAAILGGLAVSLTTLMSDVQDQGANTRAHSQADALVQTIQDAFEQDHVCDNALRNGGTFSTYTSSSTNAITQIVFNNALGGLPATTIATGQQFPTKPSGAPSTWHPQFTLTRMNIANDATAPMSAGVVTLDSAPGFPANSTFTTQPAQIQMTFSFDGAGAASAVRTVNVVLALSGARIVSCRTATRGYNPNFDCTTNTYPGFPACPTPAPPFCSNFHALVGFDGFGMPRCACLVSCQGYRQGPTGTASCNYDITRAGCGTPAATCGGAAVVTKDIIKPSLKGGKLKHASITVTSTLAACSAPINGDGEALPARGVGPIPPTPVIPGGTNPVGTGNPLF